MRFDFYSKEMCVSFWLFLLELQSLKCVYNMNYYIILRL